MTVKIRAGKRTGGKKSISNVRLSLPKATKTMQLDGKDYLITPAAEMADWLEDMEDILDSREAMRELNSSIPWEEVKKELGIKISGRISPVEKRRSDGRSSYSAGPTSTAAFTNCERI
jgi:hypothetical protein